jgi:hypothetical protein
MNKDFMREYLCEPYTEDQLLEDLTVRYYSGKPMSRKDLDRLIDLLMWKISCLTKRT